MRTRKIRVLHVLPSISGYGAERQIVELLRLLPCGEIEAALLTIYEPAPEELADVPFPVLSAGRKSRSDRFFLPRMIARIREFRPDIVHTHTRGGKYWGRCAALLAGVRRIVYTEHNPCDGRRTALERLGDLFLHPITTRIVTFFKEQGASLAESEHVPPGKLVFIPNGLPLGADSANRAACRDALGIESRHFAIMVIARLHFQKNQVLVLRALAEMPPVARRNVVVLFAGAGEDENELRGLARALSVAEHVRFLGYRSDVPKLLAAADLVLLTSWFEGMPLVLLEAMLAGIPIVSTPWVGARDMLGDGRFGFLTKDYDPIRVAEEIVRAMTHPRLCRDLAERAQKHARVDYGIGRMVEAHRALYQRLEGALP